MVYCAGRITFGKEATALSNCVAYLLVKGRQVLLHLGAVEAVDAAGLGVLARLGALARTSGRIELCSVPEHVARLLEITRMSQVLQIRETEAEALAAPGSALPQTSLAPATV